MWISRPSIVYLSSINVYPCVDNPRRNRETTTIDPAERAALGLHKHLAEQIVRRYAASWLICRLGGMVGAGMWKNSIFDILHDRRCTFGRLDALSS